MEAAAAAAQRAQAADLAVQGPQRTAAGACGHRAVSRAQAAPPRPPAAARASPGFTDASTTLQGLLLRCPVMRSFRKGFSPSATSACRAGHRVVSTRCPTSGLSRLSPSWAWDGTTDTSQVPAAASPLRVVQPQGLPTGTLTF